MPNDLVKCYIQTQHSANSLICFPCFGLSCLQFIRFIFLTDPVLQAARPTADLVLGLPGVSGGRRLAALRGICVH